MVTSYLTAILQPTKPDMGMRNSRELRTLAETIDKLLAGDIVGAADMLAQRFKAVELAATEGSWSIAKHLELIPEGGVTSLSARDREAATKKESQEIKLRSMTAAASEGGGGRRGDG